MWLDLLWYLLYCCGLELNPQYLPGMPVLYYCSLNSAMSRFWRVTFFIDWIYKLRTLICKSHKNPFALRGKTTALDREWLAPYLAQPRIHHWETFTLNLIFRARILWLPIIRLYNPLTFLPTTLTDSPLEERPPQQPFCDTASEDFFCSFPRTVLLSYEEPEAVVNRFPLPSASKWIFPRVSEVGTVLTSVRWASGCK